ncbi:MAG: NAD(P)/FAD-dependent oxidoreductase [Patescibacteria group bacterium]
MTYDLIIIGGGPAAVAAAVYAARKGLHTALITDSFGGQSIVSLDIENWIGDQHISGEELADKLEAHIRAYESDDFHIFTGEKAQSVNRNDDGSFVVTTSKGEHTAQTILVTTGSHRKKLPVAGADQFEHKGITYCASCDGPFFTGKDVVVIGGGNAGFESAAQLLAYTKSVTLLQRSENYRADAVTVEKVLEHPNMTGLTGVHIKEIRGDKMVNEIVYEKDGEEIVLPTDGIFVEIGSIPTTGFVQEIVDLDEHNNIVVDPKTQRTTTTGIWAAGDCTDGLYHQNNIAAGDAVKALENIYLYLKAGK